MLFNSYIFIFIFLPLVILLYFTINRMKYYNTALVFLLGMCFGFYGFFNPSYLLILVVSLVFNYVMGICLQTPKLVKHKKAFMLVGITVNLGVLFVYKYLDFFLENVNVLLKTDFSLYHIVLPLGISFFTFQQLSYLIDASKGQLDEYEKGIKGFVHYAVYVSFFPQLVAGPIVLHNELMPQLTEESRKNVSYANLNAGLYIFVRGLSKKILLADIFSKIADSGYSIVSEMNTTTAVIVMLAYTLQIYFDFGGYSDMAIGLAKMLNFDLPVNFNSPYKALNINEFWKRWHITLTRFFRLYVYFPMGGNRKGLKSTCWNIFIVFLLSGIWHGADWTFIIWGIMHGIALVLYRLFNKKISWIPKGIAWFFTFLFVNLAWIMFRAESIMEAFDFYRCLFTGGFGAIHPVVVETFSSVPEIVLLSFLFSEFSVVYGIVAIILIGMIAVVFMRNTIEKMETGKDGVISTIMTVVLAVWCICSLSGGSTFLYFNF